MSDENKTYSFEEEGHLEFHRIGMKSIPFGSATVLGRGKDLDYLVYDDSLARALLWFLSEGFTFTGTSVDYTERKTCPTFTTFRKGPYNIVLMHTYEDYANYCKANKLCVDLNIVDKEKRIEVFQAVGDVEMHREIYLIPSEQRHKQGE